ncbi:hypothetical protein DO97_04795 [Neosynechococcus sphagnicola sy1]|uniref:Uncharacterized protein n=2 Tax=Neosynechococcus TaxID=1501143 RepID=A0A098TPN8_9CYAN|nr:hypothetical protein DO97_04795 [Neosynechococcus sphagnicola sy1]
MRNQPSEFLNLILSESEDFEKTIISSENFDLLNYKQVCVLGDQLDGLDVTVIYVYRRADELLLSNWQQLAKQGNTDPCSDFFFWHFSRPLRSPILNPCALLDYYRKAFSPRIRILDYETVRQTGDLAQAVLSLVASNVQIPSSPEKVNVSPSVTDSEILRALNVIYSMRHRCSPRNRVLKVLTPAFKKAHGAQFAELGNLIQACTVKVDIGGSYPITTMQRRLSEVYADDIIGTLSSAKVVNSYDVPSSNWLLAPEAVRLITDLYDSAFPN